MEARRPRLPKKLTFENVQAYKFAMRRYDQQRIACDETTSAQVQWENSLMKAVYQVEVLRFPEAELDKQ